MSAAAAQIIAQRLQRFTLGRVRVDREQRFRGHDHAVEAVAALRGLLFDEGLTHGVGLTPSAPVPVLMVMHATYLVGVKVQELAVAVTPFRPFAW